MTFQRFQKVYAQSTGVTSTTPTVVFQRDPTSYDTNYSIGQVWQNQSTPTLWYLNELTSASGELQASWELIDIGQTDVVLQLQADDSTLATPVDGVVIVSGGSTGLTTTASGQTLELTGTLDVAYGGTGANSFNEYEILVGNGTSAIAVVGNVISSGIPLISKGLSAVPAYGTCTVPGGGTDKTSFTEYALVAGGTSTTGALQQVSISGASAGEVLTYVSSSALPTWQANAALQTIDGDSGSATGTTITLTALAASVNCGASVDFSATGSTVKLNVTDSSNNTFIGKGTGTASSTGSSNTGLGYQSILASTGDVANTAVGYKTLSTLNGGSANTVMGGSSGLNLATGGYNTLLGYSVGANYTGSESSNIVIGALNAGNSAESHALRIGNGTGTGLGNLNAAYISGINGVTSSNPLLTTINSSTDQLGVVATGNNGVLITSNSGVPSLLANGTAGYVLTANSGAPPSWKSVGSDGAFSSINVQTFTTSGTYTPTSGMVYCIVEAVGAGGGGGGAPSTSTTQVSVGGGGGGGSYARLVADAATIGSSQTVTVGSGGTAGSSSGGNGTTGGTTSLGSLCIAPGGSGGGGGSASTSNASSAGAGGIIGTGTLTTAGNPGNFGFSNYTIFASSFPGSGGSSFFGGAAVASLAVSSTGASGTTGGGGAGGGNGPNQSGVTGGAGGNGLVIITEYIA